MFMTIRNVNAVVLFLEDLEKSMQFYRDGLGLEVVFSDDTSYAMRLEGQDFALVKMSSAIEMVGEEALGLKNGTSHRFMLCADVESVDATYKDFTARGVTFLKPPTDQYWGFRTAYFADPEGNIWELRHSIPVAKP
jgi:catechol 2,3-dioxygenase-like lactoylglutathione lyase family enzyme